jgi:hypothetical protein
VKNDYGTKIRGQGPEWAGRAIKKSFLSPSSKLAQAITLLI